MGSRQRDLQCQQVNREIGGDDYRPLLERLRKAEPLLRRFDSWSEVVAFMQQGRSGDPGKDAILSAILRSRPVGRDRQVQTVLLAIFWPGLAAIHLRRRGWDPDPDERWQNILCAFLRVIRSRNTARRREGLACKVISNTVHRLHDLYQVRWGHEEKESPGVPEDELRSAENPGLRRIEIQDFKEAVIRELREYLRRGKINALDFQVLLETKVHGLSLLDYAKCIGLPLATVKKRRQRAERRIRRWRGFRRERVRCLLPSWERWKEAQP